MTQNTSPVPVPPHVPAGDMSRKRCSATTQAEYDAGEYTCTAEEGHGAPHAAYASASHLCHTWPQEAPDEDIPGCDADWGSAMASQKCTLDAGHAGPHEDHDGKRFGSEERPPPLSRDLSGDLMGLPGGRPPQNTSPVARPLAASEEDAAREGETSDPMAVVFAGLPVGERLARIKALTPEQARNLLIWLDGWTPDGVNEAFAQLVPHEQHEDGAR